MKIEIKFDINILENNDILSKPTISLPAHVSKEKRELLTSEVSKLNEKLLKTIIDMIVKKV